MSLAPQRLRQWSAVHRWSSLICTLFLLIVCVTGLPVLFQDELRGALIPDDDPPYAVLPPGTPNASLDALVAKAYALYPGQIITNVSPDADEPAVLISMAPSWRALEEDKQYADRHSGHWIKFDARTGAVLKQSRPPDAPKLQPPVAGIVLGTFYRLHRNLFAGLPGALFLAAMGLCFVVALASGVVVYAPFGRKPGFGAVRLGRSGRLKWLDLHNLLGITTMAWALLVGLTGVINELQTPLFALWRATTVPALLKPWAAQPALAQPGLASVQHAFDEAQRALPDHVVTGLTFPGAPIGTRQHYLLWTRGKTPLTHQLFDPVLVDARTGALTAVVDMPWYLRLLEISRPLHFGDYGGWPLKVLWALLDAVTIGVLISGLVLWWGKRNSGQARPAADDQERPVPDAAAPRPQPPGRRIWAWPAGLVAAIVFGIFSALLGQGGIWWPLTWAALALPLLVVAGAWLRARRHADG